MSYEFEQLLSKAKKLDEISYDDTDRYFSYVYGLSGRYIVLNEQLSRTKQHIENEFSSIWKKNSYQFNIGVNYRLNENSRLDEVKNEKFSDSYSSFTIKTSEITKLESLIAEHNILSDMEKELKANQNSIDKCEQNISGNKILEKYAPIIPPKKSFWQTIGETLIEFGKKLNKLIHPEREPEIKQVAQEEKISSLFLTA